MGAGIQRSQVFQAVQTFEATYKRPLPSFQKPVETSWFPSISDLFRTKVYVSHKDSNLSFFELNWINKLGRRCFGWHKDTVFTDAAAQNTLAKVKEYVDGILTESQMFKAVESLLPKAQTSGDMRCLHDILICHKGTESNEINNAYINEQIADCENKMGALAFDPRFSEAFLEAAIESASKDDMIWDKIEDTLKADTNTDRGALNLALLKEIRGQSVKVPCQNLPISEDIKTAIRTEIDNLMYSKEHSRALEIGLTRTDYTRLLEMKSQHWTNLRCIQLCLVGKERQLKTALSDKLIENGAYKSFVLAYLRDTPSLAAKLLDHTEMSAYRKQIIQQKIDAINAALLLEIKGYEVKWPEFASEELKQIALQAQQEERNGINFNKLGSPLVGVVADHFGNTEVASKAREQTAASRNAEAEIAKIKPQKFVHDAAYDRNMEEILLGWLTNKELNWREQIANELAKPEYQTLIEARIKKDDLLQEVSSQAEYCGWIKQIGSLIGMPELEAISSITTCAVFVVQDTSHGYEIIERINFNNQVSSFVFYKHDSGHCYPMIKKTR